MIFVKKKNCIQVLIFAVFLLCFPTVGYSHGYAEMKVHFIDVGQGDSILIETPLRKNILIDGGPPSAGKKVVSYLKSLNIHQIDLLVATHPDKDHIGGLPHVMKSMDVNAILDSGKFHTTKTYARYMDQVRKQDIPIKIAKKNQQLDIDPTIEISVLNTYEHKKNNNQSSIVLNIGFDEMDFLLLGDVEKKQEEELIRSYQLEADIVKIAHHGSKTSSSIQFLKEIDPKIALLTYSKTNDFGHPVNRVIENLNKIKAHIYSTAVFGNVVISTNGESFFIDTEKSPIDSLVEAAS